MKVFEIYNKNSKEVFFVHNKDKFCKERNLTRRLLDYTYTGQRNHHKGWILRQKLEFIPSLDGDKLLYDSDELGYFVYPTEYKKESCETEQDRELRVELVKTQRRVQKLTDQLRILKKCSREQDRKDNIQESFISNVCNILQHKVSQSFDYEEETVNCKTGIGLSNEMIVQVSDVHFGKNVNLPVNTFDYEVAKKRFTKYSKRINEYVKKHNIEAITIALTGDLINLDSHMDSLLSNEDTRANSFVEALDTLVDFIDSLRKGVVRINVVGVTGNESRIRTAEYHSNVDRIANDNFDMLLCKILKRLFKNTEVQFLNECNVLNTVFRVGRFNVAITHGDKLGKQSRDDILKFKSRMIETTNQPVDYVIFGHIHECLITSTYARSGSLCGMDEYAFNGLNISNGVSSQNIYLVDSESITGIEIKL